MRRFGLWVLIDRDGTELGQVSRFLGGPQWEATAGNRHLGHDHEGIDAAMAAVGRALTVLDEKADPNRREPGEDDQ